MAEIFLFLIHPMNVFATLPLRAKSTAPKTLRSSSWARDASAALWILQPVSPHLRARLSRLQVRRSESRPRSAARAGLPKGKKSRILLHNTGASATAVAAMETLLLPFPETAMMRPFPLPVRTTEVERRFVLTVPFQWQIFFLQRNPIMFILK